MGWTVLYVAFGVVALWLLGEVLLQHKARLRWRLLAFVGFLGVVVGVALPSILVIALGAVAFAVGQTLVTLSFRQGFTTGWALPHPLQGRRGGSGGRRRGAGGAPPLHVSDVEPVPEGTEGSAPPDQAPSGGAEGHGSPFAPPDQAPSGGAEGHGSPFDGGYDAPHDPYAPYTGSDEGPYADQGATHHGHWEDPARELLQDEDVFRAREHIAGGEPWQATPGHAPQPLPEETGGYGYAPAAFAAGPGDTGYETAWEGGYAYPDGYAPPGGQAPGHPGGAGYDTPYGYGTGQDGHGGYDGGQQGDYGGYDTGQGGYGGPGGYDSGYDGYPAAPGTQGQGYDDLAPYGGEQRHEAPDAYPGYPQDAYSYDARGGDPSAAPHPYQDPSQPYQDSYQGGGWQGGGEGSYQPYQQSPFDPPAPGYGQSPFDPPAPGYGQGPDGAWLPPQRDEGQDPSAQTAHQEYPGYGGSPEDPYGRHPDDRQTYPY
ncbi:hypothetical protein ACFV3R_14435 [Streptomyces sp. NPDC059740]|uniref:hypothetical protein n=1 Tax=Streptomyces sp. NPDC059740 TaxID=3346926 RepID=UPI00366A3954